MARPQRMILVRKLLNESGHGYVFYKGTGASSTIDIKKVNGRDWKPQEI